MGGKNKEDKEENVEFGSEEGGKIRTLGSWIGGNEDVDNRIKRAGDCGGRSRLSSGILG